MPLGTPLLLLLLPPKESLWSQAGSLCLFRTIIPLISTGKKEVFRCRREEKGGRGKAAKIQTELGLHLMLLHFHSENNASYTSE